MIRCNTSASRHKGRLATLEKKLKENEIEIEGRRGKHAIYFRDPNGYTLEYYCD